jgi:hypothetical protein
MAPNCARKSLHIDHLSTYKEAAGFVKNPPKLAPHPDFAKIQALCKHIFMALKQLVCPQSAIYGWLGLIMDLIMYPLIKPTMPFALVASPGYFLAYNYFATKAGIKMTNKRVQARQELLPLLCEHQQSVLLYAHKSITDQFKVPNTPNMIGWNSSMSICLILK